MRKRLVAPMLMLAAGAAATAYLAPSSAVPVDNAVGIVDGAAPSASTPDPAAVAQAAVTPLSCLPGADCTLPPPGDAAGRCSIAADPLLRDMVYFANTWNFLQKNESDPPLYVAGGYADPRVVRDADGTFFAGVVERQDGQGRVTDVVIAFTGANSADDFASAPLFIAGSDTPQLDRAVALYERVLHDPRYANAAYHVTGFSLGAGLTEYLLAYTIKTYGAAFADARATFIAFGVPGWAQGAATRYGLSVGDFDGRFNGYLPENDVVQTLGVSRMATDHFLAPYAPVGAVPAAPANNVLAHTPYPYIQAIGLPAWLGDRTAATIARIQSAQILPMDANYGTPGNVAVRVDGDGAGTVIVGSAANDTLTGGAGADMLCGGGGADRFRYAALADTGATFDTADHILDFSEAGGDVIDLGPLAASLRIARFSYIGTAPFSGSPQVALRAIGNETVVEIDTDGDGVADMLIRLGADQAIDDKAFVLKAG